MRPHFDVSPRAMAERFGELAISYLRVGREPRFAARLAASYAARVLEEIELRAVLQFPPQKGDRL